MKKISGSISIYENGYIPCMMIDNGTTNVGFRIANMLHILNGDNKVCRLSFYSEHVLNRLDENNKERLRGSIGPRFRWWVGSDQLAEANKVNLNVDDPRDFVKPQGIDQLRMICLDLKANNISHSTFVVRDPAIDFDITNDIPDLICGTFIRNSGKIDLILYYEYIGDIVNDIWFFSKLLNFVSCWLNLEVGDIKIGCVIDDMNNYFSYTDFTDNNTVYFRNYESTHVPMNFWDDIQYISYFEDQLRCIFNEKTYQNDNINYEQCITMVENAVNKNLITEFAKDICYSLVIWTLVNKCSSYGENHIVKWLKNMKSSLKYEVSHMILEKSGNLMIKDITGDIIASLK